MAERITVREYLAGTAALVGTASERLQLSEHVTAILENAGASREALRFSEHATGVLTRTATSRESLSFSEFVRSALWGQARETLRFGENVHGVSLVTGVSREALRFSERILGMLVEVDDLVWVVNLKTGGHAQYTGALDGSVPVEGYAVTGVTDFGIPNKKNVPDAFLHMRAGADVELATITDEQLEVGGYTISSDDQAGLHRRRIQLARGIRGTNWQFKVSGSDFTIKSLEVPPVTSQRVQ
jgi:hypothetical protein